MSKKRFHSIRTNYIVASRCHVALSIAHSVDDLIASQHAASLPHVFSHHGFKLTPESPESRPPLLIHSGRVHNYVAFRAFLVPLRYHDKVIIIGSKASNGGSGRFRLFL